MTSWAWLYYSQGSYTMSPKNSRTFQGPFSQFSRTKYHKMVSDFDRTNDFITTLRSGTLGNHDNILIGNQGFTSKSLTMFDLAKSIYSNKKVALFSFPGLSRTCIRIPGLSRPGKWIPEIPGLSRFSRTCTNPVIHSHWHCHFSLSIKWRNIQNFKFLKCWLIVYSIQMINMDKQYERTFDRTPHKACEIFTFVAK